MLSKDAERIIELAIAEDLGNGDVTTDNLFDAQHVSKAAVVTRQSAVVSGIDVAKRTFERIDPALQVTLLTENGQGVPTGTTLMTVEGPTRSILRAERLVLNFLQHLSGISTTTYQFLAAVTGTQVKVAHTRKTLPGLRALEIEAVLAAGGTEHRRSLADAVMVKDNHIQACGGIAQAVAHLKKTVPSETTIEVECDTLTQVEEAVEAGADIVLLDNMTPEQLEQAVALVKGRAKTEASGGVTLKNAMAIAKTGVDMISTSQLTMSTQAIDIGLDFITL